MSLLEVVDLGVAFPTADGLVRAVQGLSFSIDPGETLGIVGESGAGKSVAMQAMLGLIRGARVGGVARFEGRDLLTLPEPELRAIRGARIAMVFQDPLTGLHPHYRIGRQIAEAIRAHEPVSRRQAHERAVELLALVGIPEPRRRVDDYPHQFSGGMRQRAMIAMALALNPAVLIADEPTTALDVTVQAQILDLVERVQAEFGTAVVLITHDLGVVAKVADRVLVMYAGRPVEVADRRTAFYDPHHPYTQGLLASIPSSAAAGASGRLTPIVGQPPSLITLPGGCAFHPRCPQAMDVCRDESPELRSVAGPAGHRSACHLPADGVEPVPTAAGSRTRTAAPRVRRPRTRKAAS